MVNKVIIAGAGIGGLTAGVCLAQKGFSVSIYEKSNYESEQGQIVGGGIQLGANAIKVLQSLELLEQLRIYAVQPERIEFKHYDSGKVLYQSELGEAYKSQFGAPYLHIHRADLYQCLLQAVNAQHNCQLIFGRSVTGFAEQGDHVQVSLDNGDCASASLLIGADGINSVIRKQMAQGNKPRWTGHTAWRAVVNRAALPDGFMPPVVSNFVGSNKHAVIYYLRNKQMVNFVGVVPRATPCRGSWVSTAPWQELYKDFAGWHDTVQQVVGALKTQPCFQWDLYDHKPLENWHLNKVVLLGDAAHATLPFMASGAAMAIEDARILQRALSNKVSIKQALLSYQVSRLQRTARVQKQSRQLGQVYRLPRAARTLVFKFLSLRGGNADTWLPSYNPNTVGID